MINSPQLANHQNTQSLAKETGQLPAHIFSLYEAIAAMASNRKSSFGFYNEKSKEVLRFTFAELHDKISRVSAALQAQGVRSKDSVALILAEPDDFIAVFLGIVYAGAIPVPMYPPAAAGKIDTFVESAAKILQASKTKLVVTCEQLKHVVWSAGKSVRSIRKVVTAEELSLVSKERTPVASPSLEDICFLQYTSGSTSDPKGVCVTNASLFHNSYAFIQAIECKSERDQGVSWLPLYHDMGLIGFVLGPILLKIDVTFIPTMSFLKNPEAWLNVIGTVGGTITFAPNFAYGLLTKKLAGTRTDQLKLSSLRVAGCGAEPIQPHTIENFISHFAPGGFKVGVVAPSYGMAEATLAISIHRPGNALQVQTIDKDEYETNRKAKEVPQETFTSFPEKCLQIVGCGQTFPGHKVGIINAEGNILQEGEVGEIVFKGPSLANGYFLNEMATQDAWQDGWMRTGDIGYLYDGEVFISGRKKDLIILNGRNIYPQSIEWEIEKVPTVRKGNIVSFSAKRGDSEGLIVVCESANDRPEELALQIKEHISLSMGLAIDEVVVLAPGQLPKTTSGKVQRRKTAQIYEDGKLEELSERHGADITTTVKVAKHVVLGSFARMRSLFSFAQEE